MRTQWETTLRNSQDMNSPMNEDVFGVVASFLIGESHCLCEYGDQLQILKAVCRRWWGWIHQFVHRYRRDWLHCRFDETLGSVAPSCLCVFHDRSVIVIASSMLKRLEVIGGLRDNFFVHPPPPLRWTPEDQEKAVQVVGNAFSVCLIGGSKCCSGKGFQVVTSEQCSYEY